MKVTDQQKTAHMTVTTEIEVSDEDLTEALRLLVSEVFPALNIANAVAGAQTTPWMIVRQHSIEAIFTEAKNRGIDLKAIKGAVTDRPIQDCKWAAKFLKEE